MGCGLGAKLAKLILFIVNFAVWICSICLLGFGIWMLVQSSNFESLFSDENLTVVAIIFVTLGSFAFLVGFSGCCGALKDSVFLLRLYFFLMLIIVLGEVTGGILTFVFMDDVEASMTKGMTKAIKEEYNESTAATDSINWVQKTFKCCGAANYTDYTGSEFQKKSARADALPNSCCTPETDKDTCSYHSPKEDLYEDGCVDASVDKIEDNALWIGLSCLGFVVVEIFAMMITCCLISAEKENYEAV